MFIPGRKEQLWNPQALKDRSLPGLVPHGLARPLITVSFQQGGMCDQLMGVFFFIANE